MMHRPYVTTLLLACVALAAQAGGPDAAAPAQIHVDLQTVIASGVVKPVDGISSAGQPSADALKIFADSGYVAVVDLRGDTESRGFDVATTVKELGLDYISLPIVGQDAVNFDNAAKLDELLQRYDGPVLLHCGSGNRVGALLALRESLAGADDETALKLGQAAGLTRLEPVVKERLEEQ